MKSFLKTKPIYLALATSLLLMLVTLARAHGATALDSLVYEVRGPGVHTTTDCIAADADTFVINGVNADSNYGQASVLEVARLGDQDPEERHSFLHFDLSSLPANAIPLLAELELYLSQVVGGGQTTTALKAVEGSWDENTLTWNNRPQVSANDSDELTVTDDPGRKSWDATRLVNEWLTGRRENHGAALVGRGVGSARARFASREGLDMYDPRLCIEWIPYENVLDPDQVGWASGRNYRSSAFGNWFNDLLGRGYMIVDIEVDEIDGVQRVGGVWQENYDSRGWRESRNMTLSTFETRQQEEMEKGRRLIDQEVYELDGKRRYAAIWMENREQLEWATHYDLTGSELSQLKSQNSAEGYMMVDVEATVAGSALLYSAIWVDNVENLDWHEWRDLTSQEFADKFSTYEADYRMIDVESYRYGGEQYYAGIWVEKKNDRAWVERRDMSSKAFGEKWSELRDAGYRLIDYEVYPSGGDRRYAGIWRQNSSRPDWSLKSQVDTILEMEMTDHDIPGMSVAIIEDGRWRYLRGLGHADIDDDVTTDSRTIYRLASVSKAVGGVLAMQLSEENLLDLSKDVRDYVPSLPITHTYNVSQTLNNRSGIGHYGSYPNIEGPQYPTALQAALTLWQANPALVFTPPGSGYRYSTHAHTFGGAAMEKAVGDPIVQIVEDHLRSPFDLGTLRAEDRSVAHHKRSLLYVWAANSINLEAPADNLSWKVLGGGMEASSYDLARFGQALLDNTILTNASRQVLWTPPNASGCQKPGYGYALGWCVGAQAGTAAVYKTGSQLGADSYILIYPDENIVIVLLANRKEGGQETEDMGDAIGALMLAERGLPATSSTAPVRLQSGLEEIEEPDAEGLPAEYIVWPVSEPEAEITPDDMQEPDPHASRLYLPFTTR